MSAKDLAQHTAEIGAAALLLTGATAASTLAPFSAPVAALAALTLSQRNATLQAAIARASSQALIDLENAPDLTAADLARARALLTTSQRRIEIDPRAFAQAAPSGEPDARLADVLLAGIDFAPDDHGPRRALELTLTTVIRTCRTHDGLHAAVTQELLIAAAENAKIQVRMLQRIDTSIHAVGRITERTEATTIRIEQALQARSQADLERIQKKEAQKTLDYMGDLLRAMKENGITPEQISGLLNDMRYNKMSIRDLARIVRRGEQ
jgi:hypothetical protein